MQSSQRANKMFKLVKTGNSLSGPVRMEVSRGSQNTVPSVIVLSVYQIEDQPVCLSLLPSRCWTPGRKWHHEGWQRFGAMACSSPQFEGAHTLWSRSLPTSSSMMEGTTNPNLTEKEKDMIKWDEDCCIDACFNRSNYHINKKKKVLLVTIIPILLITINNNNIISV